METLERQSVFSTETINRTTFVAEPSRRSWEEGLRRAYLDPSFKYHLVGEDGETGGCSEAGALKFSPMKVTTLRSLHRLPGDVKQSQQWLGPKTGRSQAG